MQELPRPQDQNESWEQSEQWDQNCPGDIDYPQDENCLKNLNMTNQDEP